MRTFRHSGDLGDIILSLPVIRELGGGCLYLDPDGGKDSFPVRATCLDSRTNLNKSSIDFITPLLLNQDYIKEVKYYSGEKVDVELDYFRTNISNSKVKHKNVLEACFVTYGISIPDLSRGWLKSDKKILNKKVAVIDSGKRPGNFIFRMSNKRQLELNGIFLGTKKEHEIYEWKYNTKIEHYKEDSVLDLVSVINGAETIIANSTCMLTVALGLAHPRIIHDMDPHDPSTIFQFGNITYV